MASTDERIPGQLVITNHYSITIYVHACPATFLHIF